MSELRLQRTRDSYDEVPQFPVKGAARRIEASNPLATCEELARALMQLYPRFSSVKVVAGMAWWRCADPQRIGEEVEFDLSHARILVERARRDPADLIGSRGTRPLNHAWIFDDYLDAMICRRCGDRNDWNGRGYWMRSLSGECHGR